MIALRQWGQKYGGEVFENPVLVDERDRLPIGPVSILSHDGRILGPKDLALIDRAQRGIRADGSKAEEDKGALTLEFVKRSGPREAA